MALIVPGQEALRTGHADIALTRRLVELTGFEPVAPRCERCGQNSLTRGNGSLSVSCGAAVEQGTRVHLYPFGAVFLRLRALSAGSANHLLRLVRKAHKGARVRVISIG